MEVKHTLYEWCLLNNIQILDLEEADYDPYMLDELSLDRYKDVIQEFEVKYNSTPTKPEKYLELRMYGLVPYNLSPIQQGIQFNHANDNYSLEYGDFEKYEIFRREWKTNILLNGGTSNEGHMVRQGFKTEMYYGSMQQHLTDLKANGIRVSTFYEPDLNSMLTAIVFLVDERVFNKKLYPDYLPLPFENASIGEIATPKEIIQWTERNSKRRIEWVNNIGGPKNEFLRDFLVGKKLA